MKVDLRRLGWWLSVGWSVFFLAIGAYFIADLWNHPDAVRAYAGQDLTLYRDAAVRWLAGGPFYEPYELAGPYVLSSSPIMYPPVALLLFVPFTILPAILWWVVPLGLTAWSIWRLHPGPLAWPLMAVCAAAPVMHTKIVTGNPVIWAQAGLALGCVYAGPAVLVLLKPSLAPFALVGSNHRQWWVALGALALVSLPFGAMWIDWLTVIRNAQDAGIFYSVADVPILLLPFAAWIGRSSRRFGRLEAPSSGIGPIGCPVT